jgi:hypothetical protein
VTKKRLAIVLKGCSAPLILRKIQIKTTMRYHLTAVKVTTTERHVLLKVWRKGNPCTLLIGMQIYVAIFGKNDGDPHLPKIEIRIVTWSSMTWIRSQKKWNHYVEETCAFLSPLQHHITDKIWKESKCAYIYQKTADACRKKISQRERERENIILP